MGREEGEEREGKTGEGRGGEGTGREGTPNILSHPSSSFLEICLIMPTIKRRRNWPSTATTLQQRLDEQSPRAEATAA